MLTNARKTKTFSKNHNVIYEFFLSNRDIEMFELYFLVIDHRFYSTVQRGSFVGQFYIIRIHGSDFFSGGLSPLNPHVFQLVYVITFFQYTVYVWNKQYYNYISDGTTVIVICTLIISNFFTYRVLNSKSGWSCYCRTREWSLCRINFPYTKRFHLTGRNTHK